MARFSITMDDDLVAKVDELAAAENLSRSSMCSRLIQERLECDSSSEDRERCKKVQDEYDGLVRRCEGLEERIVVMQDRAGDLMRQNSSLVDEIKWWKSHSAQLAAKIPDALRLPPPKRSLWKWFKRDE